MKSGESLWVKLPSRQSRAPNEWVVESGESHPSEKSFTEELTSINYPNPDNLPHELNFASIVTCVARTGGTAGKLEQPELVDIWCLEGGVDQP